MRSKLKVVSVALIVVFVGATPAVAAGVPAAPGGVSATPLDGGALVTWTLSPDDDSPDGYFYYYAIADPGGNVAYASGGATSTIIGDLQNGTSYTFTVVAGNDDGESAPSALSTSVQPTPPLGTTELISVDEDHEQHAMNSGIPAMTPDGRFVAFGSDAPLVPADTNNERDVYLADRQAGTIERVSIATDGDEAHGWSDLPAVSDDGRYIAFWSYAPDLVGTQDTNGISDVFIRDRLLGETELVSVSDSGGLGNGHSSHLAISGDGRYVAFLSLASTLLPPGIDTNGFQDVFIRDRAAGTTELVSMDEGGGPANNESWSPSISDDGRYVAFSSDATDLIAIGTDTNGRRDVFVHDRATGITERVSVNDLGVESNFGAGFGRIGISGQGRYVVFSSGSTNLVPDDTNNYTDVFLRDRVEGATERVSLNSLGLQGSGLSENPSISDDGRFVAFYSEARSLIPIASNNIAPYLLLRDRLMGTTERLTVALDGGLDDGGGGTWPVVSGDGSMIAFQSWATNLVSSDTNGRQDIFVRTRVTAPTPPLVDLIVEAEGSGIVTSAPAGIDCGSTCTAEFDEGTQVTLTATPDPGWAFQGWSGGGCFTTGTCTVTMSQDRSVTATFTNVPVGQPVAWGDDTFGKLGNGNPVEARSTPDALGLTGVMDLSAGGHYSLAVMGDGTVRSWGSDDKGQLGDGGPIVSTDFTTSPVVVGGLSDIVAVSAGGRHSLALDSSGDVWTWGDDTYGQLGDGGSAVARSAPARLTGLPQIAAISAGGQHSLALDLDGNVWAWGWDGSGQVGDGGAISSTGKVFSPVRLTSISDAAMVSAGSVHSLALRTDGTVLSWGSDSHGQLGDGATYVDMSSPVAVSGLTNVDAVDAGGSHSLALLGDGTMRAWGDGMSGQLGNDDCCNPFPAQARNRTTPDVVLDLADVEAISAGTQFSLALRDDGTLWSFGNNLSGQLGRGVFAGVEDRPVQVLGVADVELVDAGATHALAIANTIGSIGEVVETEADPGAPVTTDVEGDGATASDPVETGVTSPSGGTVTIEDGPIAVTPPSGYAFAGSQVQITAPTETPDDPLVLVFTIDASQLPAGQSADTIAVFRNGALVGGCTGSAGTADPDPCVSLRETLGDGDVRITVLTSEASLWQLGFAVPVAEAGGPYTVEEGSTVQLDGSTSTGTAPLTFAWTADPALDDPTSATPTFTGLDDATTVLSLAVADAGGLSGMDETSVETTNADPQASLEIADSAPVNDPVSADVTFTDPGTLDTHEVQIDWGDGTTSPAVTEADGSGSASDSHAYSVAGTYEVQVTVTDDDGGADTASASVSIYMPYVFHGFAQPVDDPDTVNVGKAGRTYPVTFQLTDGDGAYVTSLSAISSITYKPTSCGSFSGDPKDSLETSVSGGTSLRYDADTNQFIYNWKTPSGAGCFTLFVNFDTGQPPAKAYFNLK